ncbi:Protein CBG20303 [Caenorhabditis briggsae]|uniref:Protein CBG20303 n=1 Tax=Caenorhabditis briggsae TaxID=6238 RepID=A8XXI0_CAEBR|nr:Protein CBG20303 [Caenorhabditis briggsae]CAP37349.2 Protein CBG20303 [Caenorhabditis briggsae]
MSDQKAIETIPSIPSKPSPSRIPVLQKGYQFEKSTEEEKSTKTAIPLTSKIPRPLIFIDRYNVSSLSNTAETSELPSFTQKTGDSFTHSTMVTGTHSATMPPGLSPLPYCSSSSNSSEDIQNQVLVVSEASNGLQMTFDMQKVVSAFGLDFAGIKII